MDKKVKPIEDIEGLCFKCLQKKNITTYSIGGRGYGSSFDGSDTFMQICNDCKPKDIDLWFDEEPTYEQEYCECYKYEDNIRNFANTFSLEGQELFWNGEDGHFIESQDWIDMELGILPDEKYKEYGRYSPGESKSYKERFPKCQHPVNEVFSDGSVGCWCPFGASGRKDQEADEYNISEECHYCEMFKERTTPIMDIKEEDWEDYELYILSKNRMDYLKEKFDK